MLPNFLIIGAPRSGTTYLKACLEQHPDIYMPGLGFTGDIHFFDINHTAKNWDKGVDWYKNLFTGRNNEKAIGEKSCYYYSDPDAPKAIKSLIPDVKLIAILRNPIERAYSTYLYNIGEISRNASFVDACKVEKFQYLEFIESGLYFKHLQNYVRYFKDEQFHFIVFDFLKMNPLNELKRVYKFLEVEDKFIPKGYNKKVNSSVVERGLVLDVKYAIGGIKLKFPTLYEFIKKLFISRIVRNWVGTRSDKLSQKSCYPDMTREEWNYLSDIFLESSKKMGNYLKVDLVSLWHKPI